MIVARRRSAYAAMEITTGVPLALGPNGGVIRGIIGMKRERERERQMCMCIYIYGNLVSTAPGHLRYVEQAFNCFFWRYMSYSLNSSEGVV